VVDGCSVGNDARFPALGLDARRLVVGHSDESFCFGIKNGIKWAGRNGKILMWQRIISGFDPSRPSQSNLMSLLSKAVLCVCAFERVWKLGFPFIWKFCAAFVSGADARDAAPAAHVPTLHRPS